MTACGMCLRPCDADTCEECVRWATYWASLTPEQRRQEELMMARYAEESDR